MALDPLAVPSGCANSDRRGNAEHCPRFSSHLLTCCRLVGVPKRRAGAFAGIHLAPALLGSPCRVPTDPAVRQATPTPDPVDTKGDWKAILYFYTLLVFMGASRGSISARGVPISQILPDPMARDASLARCWAPLPPIGAGAPLPRPASISCRSLLPDGRRLGQEVSPEALRSSHARRPVARALPPRPLVSCARCSAPPRPALPSRAPQRSPGTRRSGFWRFCFVWFLWSCVTGYMLRLAMQKPIATTTPRRIYAWFLMSHRCGTQRRSYFASAASHSSAPSLHPHQPGRLSPAPSHASRCPLHPASPCPWPPWAFS